MDSMAETPGPGPAYYVLPPLMGCGQLDPTKIRAPSFTIGAPIPIIHKFGPGPAVYHPGDPKKISIKIKTHFKLRSYEVRNRTHIVCRSKRAAMKSIRKTKINEWLALIIIIFFWIVLIVTVLLYVWVNKFN